MKRMPAQAEMPELFTVECTYCGVEMTEHAATASRVRYFRCQSCRRCFSSMYAEIFRADARERVVGGKQACTAGDFDAVKQRLEHWLLQLDRQDPYRVLGLSRQDTLESIKSRYRELALQRHPDRGRSLASMEGSRASTREPKHVCGRSSTSTVQPRCQCARGPTPPSRTLKTRSSRGGGRVKCPRLSHRSIVSCGRRLSGRPATVNRRPGALRS